MKIVVLVKQVPRPDSISFDDETKSLRREGVPLILNPFDAWAVAHAASLRNEVGGEVVAMTMGPPQAEEALREAIALGADRGVHLTDRLFALADTIGTSRTLALALEREGADLVLCGRKTVDAETWQVPPEVAAFLDWPVVTSAVAIAAGLRVTRLTDSGRETWDVALPAVVSIALPPPGFAQREPIDGQIEARAASDLVDDVREHDKRFGQTGSPTRVLAVRDVTPERLGHKTSDPADAARVVHEKLAALEPRTAWDKPARLGEQPGKNYDCWTLVETIDGRPLRVSLELIAKGRELAGKLGGRNVGLLVGHGVGDAAVEIARRGAEAVYVLDDPRLSDGNPELLAGALAEVVRDERPHVLLIGATARGREIGPWAAGMLELGMTGDCVDLGIDRAGRLIQFKPAYGGNIVSVIMGSTTPQLATVRPRMFDPLDPRDGAVQRHDLTLDPLPQPRVSLVGREESPESAAYELDEADVVVCIGAAAERPAELEEVARASGAAIGADRIVCERGLLPPNRWIGLHGRAVAPRVYVAVGCSGDFEHATASVKARTIVAVGGDEAMQAGADVALEHASPETLAELLAAL